MDGDTFRVKLLKLMQRSRKALRLYSSVGRMRNDHSSELSDLQIAQWKLINAELVKQLSLLLDGPAGRSLSADVLSLRDRFYHEWRQSQANLHRRQNELIALAEKGDFAKVAVLSRELVGLKARSQAAQAAQHELSDVLKRVNLEHITVELRDDSVVEELKEASTAKILPFIPERHRSRA